MTRLSLLAVFLSVLAPALLAGTTFNRGNLFDDEPVEIDPDDEPWPEYEPDGRMFASAFWVAPLFRSITDPDVEYMSGVGLEMLFKPNDLIGVSVSFGSWWGEVTYDTGEIDFYGFEEIDSEWAQVYEIEVAFRFFFMHWYNASMYLDARMAYMIADGPDPLLRTQSAGGGVYFGYEIGWRPFMFYAEGGLAFRFALSKDDTGWLGAPGEDGGAAFIIDLARVGFRVYF